MTNRVLCMLTQRGLQIMLTAVTNTENKIHELVCRYKTAVDLKCYI